MSPDHGQGVRAPAVLAGYRCGHSLVCCAAPWRATLLDGEFERIANQVAAADSPVLSRAQFGTAVNQQRPPGVVKQPGGECALLDRPSAACRLHTATGLHGLPAGCRNFPRSVVRTPDGDEAAFSLACPTAAAMVASHPAPFAWAAAAWPSDAYPPHRQVKDRVQAARGADWHWSELRSLRQAWWLQLAESQTAEQLAAVLGGMALHPLIARPADGDAIPWLQLCAPWTPAQVRAVTEGLARLPDTGGEHRDLQRQRWAHWLAPTPQPQWQASAEVHAALVGCHAGLVLQWAWVHDGMAVGPAIVRSAHLAAALVRILATPSPGRQPARDALIAVSHLARAMAPAGPP